MSTTYGVGVGGDLVIVVLMATMMTMVMTMVMMMVMMMVMVMEVIVRHDVDARWCLACRYTRRHRRHSPHRSPCLIHHGGDGGDGGGRQGW